MSYEPDISQVISTMNIASPTQDATATTRSIRFPVWAPRVELDCIDERKATPSDELRLISRGAIGTSSNGADYKAYTQGAISFIGDTNQPSTTLVVGHFSFELTLDLYGFRNFAGGAPVYGPEVKAKDDEQQKLKECDPLLQGSRLGAALSVHTATPRDKWTLVEESKMQPRRQ
jgi:hypothetical protein